MQKNSISICDIDFNKLWQRHVGLYEEVFKCSLKRLSQDNSLRGKETEDQISIFLWGELSTICQERAARCNEEIKVPIFQFPIQNIVRAQTHGANSLKKPDFTCSFYDADEGKSIDLHIECKKLGTPSSPSWVFNKNYVREGIVRFDSKEHQYSVPAVSGMMIGYIISMSPQDILTEVNQVINGYSKLRFNFKAGPVFRTQQALKRKNVEPENLNLIHLWVELKKSVN